MKSLNKGIARNYALIAGWSLFLMTFVAIFAQVTIFETLVIKNDAGATAQNIKASLPVFSLAVFAFSFVALLDLIVAWSLYHFLKPVHKGLSLITALLRV